MDRMPDAMAVFAKALNPESYAKNPQKAIEDMMATIKAGNLKALDTLPKVFKVFHEIYGPQAAKAMYGVTQEQNRFNNTLNDFKNIIFQGGLANATVRLFGALNNLLKGAKPLAALLGGIGQGFADILYYIQLGEAYFLDFAVSMGWLNYETGKWRSDILSAFSDIGEAAGILFGIKLIKWLVSAIGSFTTLGATVGTLASKFGIASGFAVTLLGAIEGIAKFAGKTIAISVVLDLFSWADDKMKELKKSREEGKNISASDILFHGDISEWGDLWSEWWKNNMQTQPIPQTSANGLLPWQQTQTFNPFLFGIASPTGAKEPYQPPVEINLNFKGEGLKDFWDVQMNNQASSLYDFQLNK